MIPREVDVLVIGAGPAGLAAALQIMRLNPLAVVAVVDSGRRYDRRPCPVDAGRRCCGCGGVCNVIAGFGGCIHYGDGVKLSRFPSGRRLLELLAPHGDELMDEALQLLMGDTEVHFSTCSVDDGPFAVKSYPVAALSNDGVSRMVHHLYASLRDAGVACVFGATVMSLEPYNGGFTVTARKGGEDLPITARQVLVAVGRLGQSWWRRQVRRLGIAHSEPTPSVGVRFESPCEYLASGSLRHLDFKTTVVSHGVKVKTFCFCGGVGGGRIKLTDYGTHTLLDGHVMPDGDGTIGNFALLAQLVAPDGTARSFSWVEENLLRPYRALRPHHPGKPVAQWFPDFYDKKMTCRTSLDFQSVSGFAPSVADVAFANLATLLPSDVHAAFCSVFASLMHYFNPAGEFTRDGAEARRVAVLGLELESLWDELLLSPAMETSIPGLYACGDCGGVAQGILQAATSGVAAATSIAGRVEARSVREAVS